MKTTTTRLTRYCSALLLAAGLASPLLASAETLRFGGNFPAGHSSSKAMEIFQQELDKRTNGDLKAQLFPNMQLGGASENVDQVRSGAIMGTWIGVSYLSRIVPELEALSVPFAFDSREDAFHLIDGEVGQMLDEKLADKGFTALGYMELGFRNVTNNVRPIDSLESFEGLKIRLQPNQTHLDTFRALGASPVSMDIQEVYSAMQQGVLDGEENPYPIISTQNFDEVQKYLSNTRHFYEFIVVIANRNSFNALSDSERQAVRAAMDKAVAWQRNKAAAEAEAARQTLIDRGMQYTSIDDATRQDLREATSGVVDDLRDKVGSDLIDRVLEELDS